MIGGVGGRCIYACESGVYICVEKELMTTLTLSTIMALSTMSSVE